MIKCGVDAVEIKRLDEINPAIRARFIQRVYTPLEQAQLQNSSEALAGVFAAKEAVAKAELEVLQATAETKAAAEDRKSVV